MDPRSEIATPFLQDPSASFATLLAVAALHADQASTKQIGCLRISPADYCRAFLLTYLSELLSAIQPVQSQFITRSRYLERPANLGKTCRNAKWRWTGRRSCIICVLYVQLTASLGENLRNPARTRTIAGSVRRVTTALRAL